MDSGSYAAMTGLVASTRRSTRQQEVSDESSKQLWTDGCGADGFGQIAAGWMKHVWGDRL